VAASLAALLAGCGGDDAAEQYKEDVPQISRELVSLGREVGSAIEAAGEQSDDELAAEFQDFAQRLGGLRDELEGLEPPDDLADEQDALVAAVSEVRDSLAAISDAAEASDPDAARTATEELVRGSEELREARVDLVRAAREL